MTKLAEFYLIFLLGFLNNQFEKQTGMDMNGDGYIGGQGNSFSHVFIISCRIIH